MNMSENTDTQGLRQKLAGEIKGLVGKLAQATATAEGFKWDLAAALVQYAGTYPATGDGRKAFTASAATLCHKSESWVRNLVNAYETREGLTKSQREKVQGWNTGKVLNLRNMDTRDATTLINRANKANADEVRMRAIKKAVVGGSSNPRNRANAAAQTAKLAENLREQYDKLIANGHDPSSLAAGARLAQENRGDVAAAILFLASNVAVPAAA
jgi:hypothetical protein